MAKPSFKDTLPIEGEEAPEQKKGNKPAFGDTLPISEDEQSEMAAKIPTLERILSTPELVETAARSALEGISFGASEPVVSSGVAGVEALLGKGDFKDLYQQDVKRRRELEQAAPGVAIGAEILGAMAPAFFSGGGSTAISATKLLPRLSEGLGKGVAKLIPTTIGKAAARAGTEAAFSEGVKQATQVPTGFIQPNEQLPIEEAAKNGAVIGAGFASLPYVGKAAGAVGTRVMSAFGGVKASAISKYLKRDKPLDPVSTEDLKAVVDDAASRVQSTLGVMRFGSARTLVQAVAKLKEKVRYGSDQSYQILQNVSDEAEKAGKPVFLNISDFIADIDRQIKNQTSEGGMVFGPVRKKTVEYLENLKKDFQGSPLFDANKISLTMGKDLLQGLDRITKYATNQGEYSSELDNALQAIRASLNGRLRQIAPEYGAHMDEVAADTRLLVAASEMFGEEGKALNNLKALETGTDPLVVGTAQQLEKITKTPIFGTINALKSAASIERLRPATSEAFLKSVMRGNSIENRKTLQNLSQLAEEDLMKMAEDAAMSEEFGKIVQNGSRDVNFWAFLLGGIPSIQTAMGAMGGLAIQGSGTAMAGGAVIGYMVKTLGAPTTKLVLDGIIKVKGVPTVQKLNAALSGIPKEKRDELMSGFMRAQNSYFEQDPERDIQFDKDMAAEIRSEIQKSDLNSIDKTNALQSLQNTSSMKAGYLRALMFGKQPQIPMLKDKMFGPQGKMVPGKGESPQMKEYMRGLASSEEPEPEYVGKLADEMEGESEPAIYEGYTPGDEQESDGETYPAMQDSYADESPGDIRKQFDELVEKIMDLGMTKEQAIERAAQVYGGNPWDEEEVGSEDDSAGILPASSESLFDRVSRTTRKNMPSVDEVTDILPRNSKSLFERASKMTRRKLAR